MAENANRGLKWRAQVESSSEELKQVESWRGGLKCCIVVCLGASDMPVF
jgi:hypothetical protein